jgi:hypothetical protein
MRVLGPDDPWTLDARRHLAYWTKKTGDDAQAREMLVAVEKDAERALGPGYRGNLGGRPRRLTTKHQVTTTERSD